jgi:hypothetical protein
MKATTFFDKKPVFLDRVQHKGLPLKTADADQHDRYQP